MVALCFPRLRRLDLSGCCGVGDGALATVAECCGSLQELCLGRCAGVSSDGVHSVATRCPNLSLLQLAGCSRVSDAAVAAVARGCWLQRLPCRVVVVYHINEATAVVPGLRMLRRR